VSSIPPEGARSAAFILYERIPLLLPAVGWVVGLLLARTDLLGIPAATGLAAVGLMLGLLRPCRPLAVTLAVALIWGGTSLMWDAYRLHADPSWTMGVQHVTADIADVRVYPDHRLLRLSHVRRSDGTVLPASVQAALYGNEPELKPGMRIDATGKWHAPRNAGNPGAFDYRAYCFDHGITLVGGLRGEVHVLGDHASWLQRLRGRIGRALAPLPQDEQGVLRALLLADRSRIPVSVQDDFAATGTAHLLAISGLHVGMVATWAFFLIWWALTRREDWIVAVPVRRLALGGGVLAACAYATLAGWPLPAQRAAMMLAAAAIAWLLRRHSEPVNTLLAALILILAFDPAAIASVSLWLSFAATAGILLVLARQQAGLRSGLKSWVAGMLAVTVVASLATLPAIASVFGRLPLYTVPANLMSVPLYATLILPLALMGEMLALLGIGAWATACFRLAGMVVGICDHLLAAMHAWPLGNLWVPDPPAAAAAVYMVGMTAALVLVYRKRKWPAAAMMAAAMLVWGMWVAAERPPSHTQWVVWDVGQGAASSLLTPDGKVLVMDVPGPAGSLFNGGTKVAAGLRAMGLAHVDVLILSHAQADHMGGAARLLAQQRRIGELWLADVPGNHVQPEFRWLAARVKAGGGRVRWLARGDHLDFGGSDIRVLWPPRGVAPSKPNNASLVLSVMPVGHQQRLLWPGDAESEAEVAMLAGGMAPHWAMLMPHHGSLTSSSKGFLQVLHPAVAIAQTGVDNRYGFPRPAVVSRYQAIGARTWNTAKGAVFVRWQDGGDDVKVQQFRRSVHGRRDRALQWWQGSL
jgi:competence protein ComEC